MTKLASSTQPQKQVVLPPDISQGVDDLQAVLQDISKHIVGNDHILETMGIALVASANLFLFGQPGLSKTLIFKLLAARFQGKLHRMLYGPYLEPEALFGSMDVNAFMRGEYVRHREGTILEASIHFGDEFFKSSDAMKVAMLGLFDEVPTYDERGKTEYLEDLLLVAVASNELPSKEDAAIADRLVLQVPVNKPGDREDRLEILHRHHKTQQGDLSINPQAYVSVDQIKALREYARKSIHIPAGIFEKLVSLDEEVTEKLGVWVSPRTLNRCLDIMKASALMRKKTEVTNGDFAVLQFAIAPIPYQSRVKDIILDLTAPLEKEALEVMTAISKEVAQWRLLASSPDRRKKAQAQKGSFDLINSLQENKAVLEVLAERAERDGYDAEGIKKIIEQVDQQYEKVGRETRDLYSQLTSSSRGEQD